MSAGIASRGSVSRPDKRTSLYVCACTCVHARVRIAIASPSDILDTIFNHVRGYPDILPNCNKFNGNGTVDGDFTFVLREQRKSR